MKSSITSLPSLSGAVQGSSFVPGGGGGLVILCSSVRTVNVDAEYCTCYNLAVVTSVIFMLYLGRCWVSWSCLGSP